MTAPDHIADDGKAMERPLIERLAVFLEHAALISFDGCDFDGYTIQEVATDLGLLICEQFDPQKHRDPNGYAEAEDNWFTIAPDVAAILGRKP